MKERYEAPSSNARLRAMKQSALEVLSKNLPQGHCISHKITLHFFKDCILALATTSSNMYDQKTTAVYSKDRGLTWNVYKDQFEPAEGYHCAIEYDPTEAPFPTKTW